MTYTVYYSVKLSGSVYVDALSTEEAIEKFRDMNDAEILDECYDSPSAAATVDNVERWADYGTD